MAYDHEKLKKYILGELDEKESDEFGELVVCDTDFADELSAVEAEMLDAFVRDELDDTLAQKIRRRYSATAHRRHKLAFARTLNESAKNTATFHATGTGTIDSNWSFLSFLKTPAFAFTVALLVVAGALMWWQLSSRNGDYAVSVENTTVPKESPVTEAAAPSPTENTPSPNRSATPPTNQPATNKNRDAEPTPSLKPVLATFLLRPAQRGAGGIQSFKLPAESREATFRLVLEPNDFESFDVVLADESGSRTVWSANGVKAGGGVLTISPRTELPRSQNLVFSVKGIRNGKSEPLGTYNFRLETP